MGTLSVKLDARSAALLWILIAAVVLSLVVPWLVFWLGGPSNSNVPQRLDIRRGNAISVSSSADGRVVYLTDSIRVYRSTDYGDSGSWTVVAETNQ